ncbi:MAG: FAD-dependent oxidoreductase [Bacillota bacterium]
MFSPFRLRGVTLRNRVVMPAMATNFARENGEPSDRMIAYYARRAQGGAALIIVENTNVSYPDGANGATQLRIDAERFVPALATLVERIHAYGAKAALQLNHAGASTRLEVTGGVQPVGPSAIPASNTASPPRELTEEEIEAIAVKFGEAARRAKKAGFDAVEIHGAHSYLLAQFLSPLTNKRTDKFGGSLENRLRFPVMVVERVRAAVGTGFPILFRISGDEFVEGGRGLEETIEVAKALVKCGVDVLHVSAGNGYSLDKQIEPMPVEEGWKVYLAARLKKSVGVPVIAVGSIRHPHVAEAVLENGEADLIAIGRGLIADPDWPEKARQGAVDDIRMCINCNVGCAGNRIFGDLPLRCSINPEAGHEWMYPETTARRRKRILVIGAGPAGMTAAVYAARRGHEVILAEKGPALGGQLNLAMLPPGKQKIKWFLDYLAGAIVRARVSVLLKTEVDRHLIEQVRPDCVIVASGSNPLVPGIPGIDSEGVVLAHDVLRNHMEFQSKKIVVAGGGMVGCEVALHLAKQGNSITVVEMLPELARDVDPIYRPTLLEELRQSGVTAKTHSVIERIEVGGVWVRSTGEGSAVSGAVEKVEGDVVVLALGARPNDPFEGWIEKLVPEVYRAGDCVAPGKIIDAVWSGYLAGTRV